MGRGGQRARRLLWRFEFESRLSLQFSVKNATANNENNQKEDRIGPFL